MRKSIIILITLFISAIAIGFLVACEPKAEHETQYFTIEFLAQEGGRIEGTAIQTVEEGGKSEAVVAVADFGYYFEGWSDQRVLYDEAITRDERVIENVSESRSYLAMFAKITLSITYIAGEHGSIEGETYQSLKYKDSAESVTAVPDVGYRFVGWSDGIETATRQDSDVRASKEITANFELISNTYIYNYKFATGNCDEESIVLSYGQLNNLKLAVPTREHCTFGGWYADRYLTVPVADKTGKIVIDDELFYSDCTQFYAKWISENTNVFKILIVYVTELNAELKKADRNGTIQVNYKMTETERSICQMITEKISWELNDLAIADFQVDEYFTTVPLTKDNVKEALIYKDGQLLYAHHIWPYNIPEVCDILNDYDSVLSSFSMDDYNEDLCWDAGRAQANYGCIHFEQSLHQLLLYFEPLENLLDPTHYFWDELLDTYLHEFAHTIECKIDEVVVPYHKVASAYLWDSINTPYISEKLYFINQAVVDGEVVGIPYEFWEGKIAEVYYEAQAGGRVFNERRIVLYKYGKKTEDDLQYVLYGKDALTVTAEAFEGYEFVGWSDGIKSPIRHDINLTEDLHVYAMFKPIEEVEQAITNYKIKLEVQNDKNKKIELIVGIDCDFIYSNHRLVCSLNIYVARAEEIKDSDRLSFSLVTYSQGEQSYSVSLLASAKPYVETVRKQKLQYIAHLLLKTTIYCGFSGAAGRT